MDLLIMIANGLESLLWKFIRGCFQLLETQDVWLRFPQKPDDLLCAQANGIDIPSRNFQHGRQLSFFARKPCLFIHQSA
jgi:hypothetical protein